MAMIPAGFAVIVTTIGVKPTAVWICGQDCAEKKPEAESELVGLAE
jgi:hypothetical protein